jgi:NADH:ubiquinone oxidoreductase subunit 2 (subunit N)
LAFLSVASHVPRRLYRTTRDIKRLMALSIITHMGFTLVGLASGTTGAKRCCSRMASILTMNVGTFALSVVRTAGRDATWALYKATPEEPGRALAVPMFQLAVFRRWWASSGEFTA